MFTKRKILLWLLLVSGTIFLILDVNKQIGKGKTKGITKKKEFSSLANTNTTCAILEKEGWLSEMENKHHKTKERIQRICQDIKDRTGRNNELPIINNRNFWVDRENNLTFCFQPKVGSSTWKGLFFDLMSPKEKDRLQKLIASKQKKEVSHRDIGLYFKDNLIWHLNKDEKYNKHEHVNLMKQLNTLKVTFVRHPFDRLFSAYVHLHKLFLGELKTYKGKINKPLTESLQSFKNNPSFPTFVDYVISEYENYWNKTWPLFSESNHWISLERKCWHCDISYDVIGKLETFSEDVAYIICKNKLDSILPLQRTLVKKNANNYKNQNISDYFSQLSNTQIQKLYNVYQIDFELFNYDSTNYIYPFKPLK